ncbi:MAG: hypothetical protein JSS53_01130, partial [Proteobacteria bacterium]|nr:hypothetical protein [Pseudomonadota bacterium]
MLKKIIISCALLACISSVHAAVESTMDPKLASSIEKILQRTQDLEKEVVALKTELKQLKEEKAQQSAYPAHHKHHASKKVAAKKAVVVTPAIEAKAPEKTEAPQGAPQKDSEKSFLTDYLPRGHTVVSSPYLGTRPSFDASDLVVNTPSVNGDIRVLQHRQQVDKTLKEQRVPASQRPLLELSGKVEGLLSQVWPYVGKNNFGINLETAEIDLLANVSTWATGFIAIQYDNSPPEVSPQRVANSRFFLEQGYFMIGNLEKFPGYLTMGQFYLPFGL